MKRYIFIHISVWMKLKSLTVGNKASSRINAYDTVYAKFKSRQKRNSRLFRDT